MPKGPDKRGIYRSKLQVHKFPRYKPFQKIDNVKKAIYNYQYYNVLAKYYQKKAHDLSRNHEARSDFLEQSNYYYSKKDEVTAKLLRLWTLKE